MSDSYKKVVQDNEPEEMAKKRTVDDIPIGSTLRTACLERKRVGTKESTNQKYDTLDIWGKNNGARGYLTFCSSRIKTIGRSGRWDP